MRIGFDGAALQRPLYRPRGVHQYARHLLQHLLRVQGGHEVELLLPEPAPEPAELPRGLRRVHHAPALPPWIPFEVRQQLYYTLQVRQSGCDVLFFPTHHAAPPISPGPSVITILDLIPERLGGRGRKGAKFRLLSLYRRWAARQAHRLLTISEASRRDIVQIYRIPAERITVTHLAAAPACRPIPRDQAWQRLKGRYPLAEPFLLAVGGFEAQKNLQELVRAFGTLKRKGPLPHVLVLAGAIPAGPEVAALVHEAVVAGCQRDVIFLGFIPENDLPALYSAADALAYPSRHEGFGLPVLEAMACGTPVVAGRGGAVPEVAGDAALLVDPGEAGELQEALWRVLTDPRLREDLATRGLARARQFSWERTASDTLHVLEGAVRP